MSARRSTRLRKKPTPVYQVEDPRNSADEADEAGSEQRVESESESSEDEQEQEEEFTPSGVKTPSRKKNTGKSPASWSRGSSARRSLRSKPRSLRKPSDRGAPKAKGGTDGTRGEAHETNDGEENADEDDTLFEAIKRGKASLENLLEEWRDRFETKEEQATREVLNFIFQACGGTRQCVPAFEPLDKLDMSELAEGVVEDLVKANEEYPIASRGRGMKKFHRSFEEFWTVFVKKCYESEILFTSQIVNSLVEWLTTLSSAEVRAIRHTTAVAILTLGSALVDTAAATSQQLSIATRQLNAEMNSPGPTTSSPASQKGPSSRKLALLKDNKALYESRLQQVLALVNDIFAGVIVHRYRDVMPEIRTASMHCLGHWILRLPEQFLKDSFLKYLGWLLYDGEAIVRLEVVEILRELYENEAFTEKLELFTSRFLLRYLELCNDVDDAVVEECIHLLIAIDKRSLISSDIELQPVEKLVFDAGNENIRKAAAEFVCLQYDAFGVAVANTKNAKLKQQQLNTQAIALVEFAEEYIHNQGVPEGAVETLVDAFWGLDDCLILQDWRLLTNLLLVDKSAPDLTSEQQTILLRLLVASVGKLVQEDFEKGASATAKKEAASLREEITVALCEDIPSLFVLYQSDTDKLALLIQLIPMLSLKSEVIGHHSSHIVDLLEKLKHAFLLQSDEELLTNLALSMKHLVQTKHESLKRETELIVNELVQELMDKSSGLLQDDEELFETLVTGNGATPNGKGKGKKRKNRKARAKEITDVEYALRISLCRLKCLIRHLDIRAYLPSDLVAHPDEAEDTTLARETNLGRMDKLVAAIDKMVCRRTTAVSQLDEGFCHADTIKHSLMVIFSDLLWLTTPVFKGIEDKKKEEAAGNNEGLAAISGGTEGVAVDASARLQVEKVCESRSVLESALVSVLEMHMAKKSRFAADDEQQDDDDDGSSVEMEELVFEDEGVAVYVNEAQRFAFMTFCDARCLFVEKFQSAPPPYDALAWLPKELISLTQMHFENAMGDADIEEPDDEDDAAEDSAAATEKKTEAVRAWEEQQRRKAELLVALSRVSVCNPSNKRQAAAVLQYFNANGNPSVEVVKAFSRQLKSDAPVRYLEIQMTALRQLFNTILFLKENFEATTPEKPDDEPSEQEALQESVESTELELKDLAKRFSKSLGVGKIMPSLRAPFLRFVCEGVRFALEQPAHYEFLEAMRVYLLHLDRRSMAQLHAYFMQRMEALNDVPDDGENLDPIWRVVVDFQASITSASNTKRASGANTVSPALQTKQRPASSEPTSTQTASIAEEDEQDDHKSPEGQAGSSHARRTSAAQEEDEAEYKSEEHKGRPSVGRRLSDVFEDQGSTVENQTGENALDAPNLTPPRKRLRRQRGSGETASNPGTRKQEHPAKARDAEKENADGVELLGVTTEKTAVHTIDGGEVSVGTRSDARHKSARSDVDEDEIDSRRARRKRRRQA